MESCRPDFFFVGHPRSGSGRLDGYLAGHPDIFMARKELHFFGSDLEYNDPPRSLENYLAHFRGADRYRRVGESSTWSLASERAAEELRAFAPHARILMILRDPVEWIHSLHSHQYFATYEDIPDFAAALAAEPARRRGECLPAHSVPRGGLLYTGLVRYREQVQRYFDAFGRDHVHVIVFDNFRADPVGVFDRVLRCLDLPTDFPGREALLMGTPRTLNANRAHRSARLHRWLKRPPNRPVLQGLVPPPVPGYHWLLQGPHRINTRYTSRPEMAPALRAELTERFRPEVEALADLLGQDLSAWTNPYRQLQWQAARS